MNKFFCVLPWVGLRIYANGTSALCCIEERTDDSTLAKNYSRDSVEIMNFKNHSIHEVINCNFYKKIRLQILNGKIPEPCRRCLKQEKNLGSSLRTYRNSEVNFSIDDAVAMTNGDGSVRSKLQIIEFKFKSDCNLKCRICSSFYSNKWTDEFKILSDNLNFIDYQNSPDGNYIYNKSFWESLIDYSNEIQQIYILGGEPMLINEHWQLLELLINKNASDKIRLMYNINGSIIPDKGLEYWYKFKNVWLGMSIDDCGKRLEYLRKGIKWETILSNIEKLKMIRSKKISVQITPVITWMSAYYLDEFCQFLDNCGILSVRSTCVYYPEFLSPWILPEKIKDNILKKCKPIMPLYDYEKFSMQMLNNKSDLKLLRQGILYNQLLDKLRNESFKNTFPELYNEIKEYWDDKHE